MDRRLQELVWHRAGGVCEYCRLPATVHSDPFPIDHIIARQHGGETVESNLALSCFRCNTHKGPNIAGIDPLTRLLQLRLTFFALGVKFLGFFEGCRARG